MSKRKDPNLQFPSQAKKIIARNIPANSVIMCCTNNGSCNTRIKIKKEEHLMICYAYPYKTYIIWNASVHRFLHDKSANVSFLAGVNAEIELKNGVGSNEIIATYKSIKNSSTQVEKVLLVEETALFEFCQHYEDYLFPDAESVPKSKIALYATPDSEQLIKLDYSKN